MSASVRNGGTELVANADLAREALISEPSGGVTEVFDEGIEGDDLIARGTVTGVIEGQRRVAGATQCATE